MAKVIAKCLFEMSDTERTPAVLVARLSEIKNTLNRLSGVLGGMSPERMRRQDVYWSNAMKGWAGQLKSLSSEIVLIQNLLAKHI